jgi:hypothetical protein
MTDEVKQAQARRWTAQLVEALVAVVRAEVPQDERADVLDDMARALTAAAEVERRGGPYVRHEGHVGPLFGEGSSRLESRRMHRLRVAQGLHK